MENQTRQSVVVSTDSIIENIKVARDYLITILLTNSGIDEFMKQNFDTVTISAVKREFLRRDLVELRSTSVDLVHYATLIKQLRETNQLEVEPQHNLIKQDVFTVFKKYGIE